MTIQKLEWWGSTNTATYIIPYISQIVSFPTAWGSLKKICGDGHLSWIMLLMEVELNRSGDVDRESSCEKLVLQEEAGLLVGLRRGRGGWFLGGLEVGVRFTVNRF